MYQSTAPGLLRWTDDVGHVGDTAAGCETDRPLMALLHRLRRKGQVWPGLDAGSLARAWTGGIVVGLGVQECKISAPAAAGCR